VKRSGATQRFICSVLTVIATGRVDGEFCPRRRAGCRGLWGHALVVAGSNRLGWSGFLRWRVGWRWRVCRSVWPRCCPRRRGWAVSIWSDVPCGRTVLGGEPMLVAIGLAVVGGGVLNRVVRAVTRLRGMDAGRVFAVRSGWCRVVGGDGGGAIDRVELWRRRSWLGDVPTWGCRCGCL